MKNKMTFFIIGQASFAAGMLIKHFGLENNFSLSLFGLLMALSILGNVVFIVRYRKFGKNTTA